MFEFKIGTADGEFWTALQGNGGQVGNGCLHINISALPDEKREHLFKRLLAGVRLTLKQEGKLYLWKGDDLPPAERIVPCPALEVLEVRYLG